LGLDLTSVKGLTTVRSKPLTVVKSLGYARPGLGLDCCQALDIPGQVQPCPGRASPGGKPNQGASKTRSASPLRFGDGPGV